MATKKKKKTKAKKAKKRSASTKPASNRRAKKSTKKKSAKKVAAPKKAVAKKKSSGKATAAGTQKKPSQSIRTQTRRSPSSSPLETSVAHSGEQSGDLQDLSTLETVDSESVDELMEEGNAFEAGVISGVEEAGRRYDKEVQTREVPEDDVPEEYLDKD